MPPLDPVSHPISTFLAPERLLRLDMLRDDAGQVARIFQRRDNAGRHVGGVKMRDDQELVAHCEHHMLIK